MFIYRAQNFSAKSLKRERFRREVFEWKFLEVFNRKNILTLRGGGSEKSVRALTRMILHRWGKEKQHETLEKDNKSHKLKNWKLFKYLAKAIESSFAPPSHCRRMLTMCCFISRDYSVLGLQHDSWNPNCLHKASSMCAEKPSLIPAAFCRLFTLCLSLYIPKIAINIDTYKLIY